MRTGSILSASVLAAALTASTRAATPVVYTNLSNLLPGKADQVVLVYVAGAETIQAEDLCFQINNAGNGPTITGVEIFSGTIFAASNTGLKPLHDTSSFNSQGICFAGPYSGRLALLQTATRGTDVATASGLLAAVTLSTEGATGSTFTLNMENTINGPSIFFGPGQLPPIYTVSQPNNQISIGSSATRQWNINGSGSWNSDANWTPFAPYASSDIANFSTALTSGTAVITLDGKRTVGTLNFNDTAGSYDLQAGTGGSLLLDNGTQAALIACLAGKHSVGVSTTLSASTTVSVASASTLTLAGGLSGSSAALSVVGSGKLILTGSANSYGATNVAPGATLQVGNGTASGSLGTAPVTNNGSMVFASMAQPLGVPMSGFGDNLITGTATITGVYSIASTVISSTGLMQVDDGGALMNGSVVNNGRLAFNRSDAFAQADSISGSGTLTQMGIGATTLTAAANYSGPTVISAGQLSFGGGLSHSIAGVSGTGSLAVAAGTILTSDGVNMPAGNLTIAGTQTIRSNATTSIAYPISNASTPLAGTSKVSSLVFNSTASGQIDIKDNGLIIESANTTSKLALLPTIVANSRQISNATQSFFNITSSTAINSTANYTIAVADVADLPGRTYFGGLPVTVNSIVVTEAIQGDANLDGTVNFVDYQIWLKSNTKTTSSYARGDFNGDGKVNFVDYQIWLKHNTKNIGSLPIPFDAGTGTLGTGGGLGGGGQAGSGLGGAVSAVPEPASLAVLALGAVGLLTRRRRRGPGNDRELGRGRG